MTAAPLVLALARVGRLPCSCIENAVAVQPAWLCRALVLDVLLTRRPTPAIDARAVEMRPPVESPARTRAVLGSPARVAVARVSVLALIPEGRIDAGAPKVRVVVIEHDALARPVILAGAARARVAVVAALSRPARGARAGVAARSSVAARATVPTRVGDGRAVVHFVARGPQPACRALASVTSRSSGAARPV